MFKGLLVRSAFPDRGTFLRLVVFIAIAMAPVGAVVGQNLKTENVQEVSDVDGAPVLIKHLPDWQKVSSTAVMAHTRAELETVLGSRAVLQSVDFNAGTEAVAATYPAAKLAIVEFTNPQSAEDADARATSFYLANADAAQTSLYRRVGNYAVFAFDVTDKDAASALIDQVKYEKTVQWLGEDPYLLKKVEKYFVSTTRDIFISTVIAIVSGIGISVLAGILAGFVFFRFRDHQRATRTRFSDAGGLTRLNLDDLSEPLG